MKRIIASIIILSVLFYFSCSGKRILKNSMPVQNVNMDYESNMKRDLLCLLMAYPDHITSIERNADGLVYAVMKSGKRLLYDDKREKGSEEKLNNPDIQDMMEQIYPLEDVEDLPDINYDPGRIRLYPLLKEVYGNSNSQVQSSLVNVKMGQRICQFNKRNNAAGALDEVMKELVPLADSRRDIYSCVFPQSGTFNYRVISGTSRLSPHSFGIAIDLASNKWDYWRWAKRSDGEKRLDVYPKEIARIFEKNNFIWGGKWGHFDILHFEYRPEIILKAKYFSNRENTVGPWYLGIPENNGKAREYADMIDKVLE